MTEQVTQPLVMAVLNVTPDSFSDGDVAASTNQFCERAEQLLRDGADVIDIGGESTRPGAVEVSAQQEIDRVLPVVEKLRKNHPHLSLSLDTRKAEVVRAAASFQLSFVNDVSCASNPDLLDATRKTFANYVLMHSRGTPATMTSLCDYPNGLFSNLESEVRCAIARVLESGIDRDRVWLDPGFGFAKTPEQCVEMMENLSFWQKFNLPLLFAVSRKRFLQNYTGPNQPLERDEISAQLAVKAIQSGFGMIRTHNPLLTRNFLSAAGFVLSH